MNVRVATFGDRTSYTFTDSEIVSEKIDDENFARPHWQHIHSRLVLANTF